VRRLSPGSAFGVRRSAFGLPPVCRLSPAACRLR
jgi:hypothetical protein